MIKTQRNSCLIQTKKFTNLKNQGGLWSISSDAFSLFKIAEIAFRKSTKISIKDVHCSKMTAELLQDVGVLSHFSKFVILFQPGYLKKCLSIFLTIF